MPRDLALGVFAVFAPIGVLFAMINQPPGTWSAGVVSAVYSGAVALGWAYAFATRRYWLLAIVVPVSFLLPGWVFPPLARMGAFDLGMSVPHFARALTLAILSIVLISVGFIFMVRHIRDRERGQAMARAELDLARRMHETLVPRIELNRGGVTIVAESRPSETMGGDLIDVVERAGEIDVYVADVSGHGVGAGIVMGMLKSALRMRLLSPAPLDVIARDLNCVLAGLVPTGTFATFACVRLRTPGDVGDAGEAGGPIAFEYAIAGHLPILHVLSGAPAGRRVRELANECLPLGIEPEENFTAGRGVLGPGESLVLMTDGLTEVQDGGGRELGLSGVKTVTDAQAGAGAKAVFDAVFRAASTHGTQRDDQTLLIIRAASGAPAATMTVARPHASIPNMKGATP